MITRPCPRCGGEVVRVNSDNGRGGFLHCNDCFRASPLPLDLQLRDNPEARPLPGFSMVKRRPRRRKQSADG